MAIDVNTPFDALPQFLTIDEFRTLTRLGKSSAYDAVHRGEIRVFRVGARLLIPREVLREFMIPQEDVSTEE